MVSIVRRQKNERIDDKIRNLLTLTKCNILKFRAGQPLEMNLLTFSLVVGIGERPEEDIPLPARYKDVVMLPMWYEPNLKEKRKHRKTHGKISFKDLTEIISKNWATIDAETKDYCTRVSEMGRKRYKEQMVRYNASQKIIQLKKEHAAMENAREKRTDIFHKKDCGSPSRPEKGKRNPTTPDRILSQHAPIVTPPNHGYNNSVPMFVPSGPPHAFHHYGPPPPMPPPMPNSMQGQPAPPSIMYHQRHHQHQHHHQYQHQHHHQHQHQHQHQYQQHHQHQYQHQYKYQPGQKSQHSHQNQPKQQHQHKYENQNQTQYRHQHQHRHQHQNQNKYQHQHQHQHQNHQKHYQNQNHHHHQHRQLRHQYSYPQAASKMSSNGHKQAALRYGDEPNQAMKFSKGKDSGRGSVNFLSSLPNSGLDVTVDVKVSLKKEEPSDRNSMTHDEAMRLCNLMGHDSPGQKRGDQGEGPLAGDTLLSEMPSFDAGDQHSLSTEPGSDSCREVPVDGILNHVENQEENILDMIRNELLPLGFGEEESLDSFPDM